jgi:hypothetical protein
MVVSLTLVDGVVVNPCPQEGVVDEATRAELLGQDFLLFRGRVDAELEGLIDQHDRHQSVSPKTAGVRTAKSINLSSSHPKWILTD